MTTLMQVLRQLGFRINYDKVIEPTQRLIFLCVTLNSKTMVLSLPQAKCNELKALIHKCMTKVRVTKKQLCSLAGKLSWASVCIYGGRYHLRRIFDRINTLALYHHRTRITKEVCADIDWSARYMDRFNNCVPMVDLCPASPVSIDSCQEAGGAYYLGDAVYTPWHLYGNQVQNLPINYKEAIALEPAVQAWAPYWTNKKIYVSSNNQAAVALINRRSCRHPIVMAYFGSLSSTISGYRPCTTRGNATCWRIVSHVFMNRMVFNVF